MRTPSTAAMVILLALAALSTQSAAQQRDRRRESASPPPPPPPPQQQAQPTTQPQPAGRVSYGDRYAVLEQRNIFVRDRSRATTRSGSSSSTQPTRRSPEESLVVRGIAMEEIGFRAYVEDLNDNSTLRVSPGDTLARGRVNAIALDAIAFEHDGKQTWIEIGCDLTGKPAPGAGSSSSLASATTSPATLPANIDLNDPSLSTEQRMRLRVQLQNQRGR